MYKNIYKLVLVAQFSLLTACGGGSGGTTPIPTPPATDLTGLFSSSQNKTFTASSAVLTLDSMGDTDNSTATNGQVIYNGTDKSLQVNVSQNGTTFNVTFDIDEVTSAANAPVTEYKDVGADADFIIRKPGSLGAITVPGTMTQITLQYSDFGLWQVGNAVAGADIGYVMFGFNTATADIPTSGTATYLGYTQGTLFVSSGGTNTSYLITGRVDVTADFGAANSVTTEFTEMIATPVAGGSAILWRNFDVINAGISGNSFSGDVDPSSITGGGSLSGSLNGSFFGPVSGGGPAEVGGTWQLQGGDEKAIGAFVGVRQ